MTTQENKLTVEQIRELARTTSEDLELLGLGYSRAAVEKVEDFVERERMNLGQEARGSAHFLANAFLKPYRESGNGMNLSTLGAFCSSQVVGFPIFQNPQAA